MSRLKWYQVQGVSRMMDDNVFIQADVMGMGKTAQAIEYMEKTAGKYIVICPASLKYNWQNELQIWTHKLIETDCYGQDVIITNYERIGKLIDDLGETVTRYKGVIFDEAHNLKNIHAARTQEARRLVDLVGNPMMLTGTPILNRPDDLIGLLYVGKKLQDFHGEEAFKYRYTRELSKDSVVYLDSVSRTEELQRRINKYIVRRTWNSLGLPAYPYSIHKEYIGTYTGQPLVSRDICNIEHTEKKIVQFKQQRCINWIKERLRQGVSLVIFAHHKALIETIAKALPVLSVVHGGLSAKEKARQIQLFKSGITLGILCSINCASVGHNFTNSCDVVFLEYPWNKGTLAQAIARCARQGQDRFVDVYFLIVKNSFDEYRLEQQDIKAVIADNIIDTGIRERDTDVMNNISRLHDYIHTKDTQSLNSILTQLNTELL